MKQKFLIVAALLLATLSSCRTRQVAYISDATRDSVQQILDTYVATILPGDQLYIYVGSNTPQSVIPFNQETHKLLIEQNKTLNLDTTYRAVIKQGDGSPKTETQYLTAEITGYTVKNDGTINFPILGTIQVAGITIDSLCNLIEHRLIKEGYVLDPQVSAKIMNFRVTVVGEVRNPQQIHVDGTRLTILEAIAICGDLTDYARRDNLLVVRTDSGKRQAAEIDLTKKEMLDSPSYYLHNNDIVYVEPTDRRKRISDRDQNVPTYISMGVSLFSIIRTNIGTALEIQRQQQ